MVKDSREIFKLQIIERNQVSRNGKRFNVGKRIKILNISNKFVRVLYLFRKKPILDLSYPHLTLYLGENLLALARNTEHFLRTVFSMHRLKLEDQKLSF